MELVIHGTMTEQNDAQKKKPKFKQCVACGSNQFTPIMLVSNDNIASQMVTTKLKCSICSTVLDDGYLMPKIYRFKKR